MTETVQQTTRSLCGRELPVIITRRVGLDTYTDPDGEPFQADEAVFMDFGPKLGVQRSYILHPETEPTPEERAAGRAMIGQMARLALDAAALEAAKRGASVS